MTGAALLTPRTALADEHFVGMSKFPSSVDELSAPRLPPPFVLPELSHRSWDVSAAWLAGVGVPTQTSRTSPALGLAHLDLEGDVIFPRRLYVGATVPFGGALSPDGASGAKTFLGNVEGHIRVVFPLPSWLAFGAVLGVVSPTARYARDSGAHLAATAASSLEPTDAVHFVPDAFALRPAMDVRVLRGPFVVQARQGIDIVVDTRNGHALTTGRFLGHAGIRVKSDVELSVELTQLYMFDQRASDQRRTALTVGPGARLSLGAIDVGAAIVTSVFDPLSSELQRFVGLRLSLVAPID